MTEPPIRREVIVPADAATAFAVFTDRIGAWWPLAELSVHGDGTVALVDGDLVETAADGRRAVWGSVTTWEPPRRLALTWHPGRDAESASRVTVTFEDRPDGTLVTLEHDGWEVYADPAAARAEYGQGWPGVLARYTAAVTA
jgi:uncharacterized protein YndB with AHSA1/START domain